MKKYVFILAGFIAIVAIGLFIGLRNTGDVDPHLPVEKPNNITSSETVPSDTKPKPVAKTADTTDADINDLDGEQPVEDIDTSKKQENYNWQDDVPHAKQNKHDPLTKHLMVEQAKTEDIWIKGDLSKMSAEEQRNAIHEHLLERFGDIPEVHAMTEFQRKKDENIGMSLDEQLEGHRAIYKLFPSESTRKSIALLEWARSKGPSHKSVEHITSADIEHLRSLGISVETKDVGDGGGNIKISTR